MVKSNFHTHTVFCDGNDTPADMAKSAYELGFTHLGFSGHSYFPYAGPSFMDEETLSKYRKEIKDLKERYKGKMTILCGIEWDIDSPDYADNTFDYKIGSVHNLKIKDRYYPIDLSKDDAEALIKEHFGDFDSFAEAYFKRVKDLKDLKGISFFGHIDLCSKYSELWGVGESERYLKAAEDAVTELCKCGIPFEINTGAMSRGYRSTPYPSKKVLSMIKKHGGKIIISSDCHSKDWIDFAFDKAEELALSCGFTEYGILDEDGIRYVKF